MRMFYLKFMQENSCLHTTGFHILFFMVPTHLGNCFPFMAEPESEQELGVWTGQTLGQDHDLEQALNLHPVQDRKQKQDQDQDQILHLELHFKN